MPSRFPPLQNTQERGTHSGGAIRETKSLGPLTFSHAFLDNLEKCQGE